MKQPDKTEHPRQSAASRYEALSPRREQFLTRARDVARYTIPSLFPPSGHSSGDEFTPTHQSVGARCVKNLANKLLLTLLPPTRKMFRLVPSLKIKEAAPPGQLSAIEQALVKLEERIVREFEKKGIRVHAHEALLHLVLAGNVVIYVGKKATRVFPLYQYVARRSPEGELLELVIEEKIDPSEVPESMQQSLHVQESGESPTGNDDSLSLYTRVYWDDEEQVWRECQEIGGMVVPESEGTYPKDRLPYMVLRGSRIDGEDYGRAHCDEFYGDLKAVEGLSRSMLRSAAIAAKTVFLVDPNGSTDVDDLVEAEEGGFVVGRKDDIHALQAERYADMQTAKSVLDDVIARLSFAFLLNSAIQRQGERVTAEEIRFMASELEDGMGGLYSILSIEFQLALVNIVRAQMESSGEFPTLSGIETTVITGIDALGRSHELARLDAFVGGALQTFGPNVMQYIKMDEYLRRRAAGLDLNTDGLIPSPEELAAQQQAAMEQQVVQAIGPNLAKGAIAGATQTNAQ